MFVLPAWSWIVFTLCASAAQTARNAMQRDLLTSLGSQGAAYVRFLYGFPFAVLLLGVAIGLNGGRVLVPNMATVWWTALGAVAQIAATALMLAAMRTRSFVVVTANTKTEPVQVALFGMIALNEKVTPLLALAIVIATVGVVLTALPARAAPIAEPPANGWSAALLGLSAASLFALSAVGFRAGVVSLEPSYLAAATILALSLAIQSALILVMLIAFDRSRLIKIAAAWRESMFAGFMGALGSQFWFIAFALETAARVRTLALIEIVFAQIVTRRMFHQKTRRVEMAGMALIALGVALLLAS